jgi:hypothetical protein
LIPSRLAISRCETPSATYARTRVHSTALRTSRLFASTRSRPSERATSNRSDEGRREWRTFRCLIPV